ncbi:MAG: DUF1064 domain-containing protein, partial [Candidatus Omnitrophota bacterium]
MCYLLVYLGSGYRREQKASPGKAGHHRAAALEPHPAAEQGNVMRGWSQRKYKNKPCIVDAIWFASGKEAGRYQELLLLEKAGEISHLKKQVNFPISIDGQLICTFRADFTYRDKEGNDVVEDTKGYRDPKDLAYRLFKMKAKLLWATQRIIIKET